MFSFLKYLEYFNQVSERYTCDLEQTFIDVEQSDMVQVRFPKS